MVSENSNWVVLMPRMDFHGRIRRRHNGMLCVMLGVRCSIRNLANVQGNVCVNVLQVVIYDANRQVDSMIESRPDILFDRQIFRKINNENLHLYHYNNFF